MSVVLTYCLKFLPFLSWAKNTTADSARQDAMAGLTGAIIVLPQGVAYALIAGLPPEYGLYALGGGLYLCNTNGSVIKPIIRNGHLSAIGKRHFFATKALALSGIDDILHGHTCAGCTP